MLVLQGNALNFLHVVGKCVDIQQHLNVGHVAGEIGPQLVLNCVVVAIPGDVVVCWEN
jgi:hypothetical protein